MDIDNPKDFEENEYLTADDQSVGEMLRELKKVEAPVDFNVKVNERIASSGSDRRNGTWLLPVPAYVIPLVLIIAAGSFFIFRGSYSIENTGVPAVTEGPDSRAKSNLSSPVGTPGSPAIAQAENGLTGNTADEVVSNTKSITDANKRSLNSNGTAGGGSLDYSIEGIKPIMPPGFDTNKVKIVRPGEAMKPSQIPITDFLTAIGIGAEFEGGSLKVKSVRQGSIADVSGVKTGDVIESLGDKKITSTTVFRGRIDAKSLTLNRGGRPVLIKFGGR